MFVNQSIPLHSHMYTLMLIGNYGNKLDTNTPAQSSTTPPTNPVFDGTKYYFLPWMDQPQKPCCVVDSWWEDCTYRIESANIIHFTADRLVRREGQGRGGRKELGKKRGKEEGKKWRNSSLTPSPLLFSPSPSYQLNYTPTITPPSSPPPPPPPPPSFPSSPPPLSPPLLLLPPTLIFSHLLSSPPLPLPTGR